MRLFTEIVRSGWQYILFLIVLVIIFVQVISDVQNGGRSNPEAPGSRIYMRGCIVAVLRLNTMTRPQDIAVCDTTTVARVANPPNRAELDYVPLTAEEQQALRALRDAWCAHPPPIPADDRHAPPDDFGVRCTDSWTVTQFKIPHDALPDVLQQLDRRLPPLRFH